MGATGLRERKKQQTRQRLIDVALELFDERGFERVPVSEVARTADVSEATVFNYFPTKEDLIYAGMEAFEATLLEAVSQRAAGTSVVTAFRDMVLQPRGALAANDPALVERIARVARVIAGSDALQTREQQVYDRATRTLAELIAEERRARSHDMRPWVIANALMGVNRSMTRLVHQYAQQGRSPRSIARSVLSQGRKTFEMLEHGLDG
jgi:AcrR family transcriptional regulator